MFRNLILALVCYTFLPFRGKSKLEIKNPKNILVLRWKKYVGDTVYITPIFRAIKKTYPNCNLIMLGKGRTGDVVANNPDIDEYVQYDGSFFKTVMALYKKRIDFACIANVGTTEGIALAFLSGAKCISLFSSPEVHSWSYNLLRKLAVQRAFRPGEYVPPMYLSLLDPINANTGDVHYRLYFSNNAKVSINKMFKELNIQPDKDVIVGLAPGGSSRERWWLAEKYIEIAHMLTEEYKARIFLIGVGMDGEPIRNILQALNPEVRVMSLLDQPFDELKAFIKMSNLVIGNDSGPMVIADAFDVPNIVLIGPTDVNAFRRSSGEVNRIIIAPGSNKHERKMEDISVHTVASVVRNILGDIANE